MSLPASGVITAQNLTDAGWRLVDGEDPADEVQLWVGAITSGQDPLGGMILWTSATGRWRLVRGPISPSDINRYIHGSATILRELIAASVILPARRAQLQALLVKIARTD